MNLHITPCEPADCDTIDRLTALAYAPSGLAPDDPYFIEILNVAQRAQQALVLVARQTGCTALVLSSAAWMTAAHRLYQRLGFRHTPERDWQPRADVHLTTYRLDLAP